jgi:hypothetical protein
MFDEPAHVSQPSPGVMAGATLLTTKVQLLLALPASSVAVQVTVVLPGGKPEPDGGLQLKLTLVQLSDPVGSGKVMLVSAPVAHCWTPPGQVIEGGSWSRTITLNVQALVLPAASVAVHRTALVPFGNVEPDAGVQLVVAFGQLSETVGAG